MADLSGKVRIQQHMSWDIDRIIFMVKLAIINEIHNIRNIFYDEKIW